MTGGVWGNRAFDVVCGSAFRRGTVVDDSLLLGAIEAKGEAFLG